MKMHVTNCVWFSRWEMKKDASGKARRVRRARPKMYAGTVYTVRPVERNDLRPFVGWTWDALQRGMPARHYGRPVTVFSDKEDMWRFVQWYEALVNWALEYGHPWSGGSPVQIEWNGVHSSDRGGYKTSCGRCDHDSCPCAGRSDVWACSEYREDCATAGCPLPRAFGNLVWARVRGLRSKHRYESLALLDLEQITRAEKFGTYVRVMHAFPRDYDNDSIDAKEIVHVYDARAEKIINGKEA